MLKLAVCDDNPLFLEEITEVLETDQRVGEVSVYENPENLLEEIGKKEKNFDAVFMDIEFEREQNGIQYVKEIFRITPEIQMIYVTGYHDKYIQQIFLSDANLTGYLMKPLDKEILGKYLDKISEKRKPRNMLTFSIRGKTYMIATDRILYLESNNHKVLIHTEEGVYSVYDKLSNIHKKLPSSFIQCHKSFLVNLNRIRHIKGNEIFFSGGLQVPVSKFYQERMRKSYFLHLGKTI